MSKETMSQKKLQELLAIARQAETQDEISYTEVLIKNWESGPLNSLSEGHISHDISDLRKAEAERDAAAEAYDKAVSAVRAKRATVESRINSILAQKVWHAAQFVNAEAQAKVLKAKEKTIRAAGKIAELKKKEKERSSELYNTIPIPFKPTFERGTAEG